MTTPNSSLHTAFLQYSRTKLVEQYWPRLRTSVESLNEEQVWWRANAASNSIGNLILHLDGNVRQWIISGLGGDTDMRERQQEFDARSGLDQAQLLRQLRATVGEADRVLRNTDPATLLEQRRIQSYDVTTLQAIYAVVEHFSMHTGQIILLAKMWKGDLQFYDISGGAPRPTWRGGVGGH